MKFRPCRIADLAEEIERLQAAQARLQLEQALRRRQLWLLRDIELEGEAQATYYPQEDRP